MIERSTNKWTIWDEAIREESRWEYKFPSIL